MRYDKGTAADVGKLFVTVGLGATAAVTPRAFHRTLLSGLGAAGSRVRRKELDAVVDIAHDWLPKSSVQQRKAIAVEMRALRIEHALCRGYGIFRQGWPARLTVSGAEHLREAHAEGRGVVMWVMSFIESTPFNLAARAEGYPVTHLTTGTHGLASTGIVSRRLVAPLVLRGERRSQGHRVILSTNGDLNYMRELLSVVKNERGTVSIRGDTQRGRHKVEAPFLGAVAAFPTGAPSLAYRTGAPLLTTATIRRGPLDHEVIIDRPVSVARDLDRAAFQHAAIQEFAARLEQRTLEYPGSRPWLSVMAARRDES